MFASFCAVRLLTYMAADFNIPIGGGDVKEKSVQVKHLLRYFCVEIEKLRAKGLMCKGLLWEVMCGVLKGSAHIVSPYHIVFLPCRPDSGLMPTLRSWHLPVFFLRPAAVLVVTRS